jgi:hypothetical protein
VVLAKYLGLRLLVAQQVICRVASYFADEADVALCQTAETGHGRRDKHRQLCNLLTKFVISSGLWKDEA